MGNIIQSGMLPEVIEEWDPLREGDDDQGLLVAAQRREIRNILKSYTGSYDLFAELFQNALDAVERRISECEKDYSPNIWIKIDLKRSFVSVTDNGCGMNISQFQQFMRPNFSFKNGLTTRGNKGVGATYLAYGFNHLEVATKSDGKIYSGVLKNGREWVEDQSSTVGKPKVTMSDVSHTIFHQIDRGTSMTLKLNGNHVRPRDFRYNKAQTANQWMSILRIATPLGGIYLASDQVPNITVQLEVVDPVNDYSTFSVIQNTENIYPHTVLGKTADLREYLQDQQLRAKRGKDISKIPPKFNKLNSIWGEWTGEEIVQDKSPIKL